MVDYDQVGGRDKLEETLSLRWCTLLTDEHGRSEITDSTELSNERIVTSMECINVRNPVMDEADSGY